MSLKTLACFDIRVVRRSVLGQIRDGISGFSRSDISLALKIEEVELVTRILNYWMSSEITKY